MVTKKYIWSERRGKGEVAAIANSCDRASLQSQPRSQQRHCTNLKSGYGP